MRPIFLPTDDLNARLAADRRARFLIRLALSLAAGLLCYVLARMLAPLGLAIIAAGTTLVYRR